MLHVTQFHKKKPSEQGTRLQGSKASDVALSWTEVFFWDEYGT